MGTSSPSCPIAPIRYGPALWHAGRLVIEPDGLGSMRQDLREFRGGDIPGTWTAFLALDQQPRPVGEVAVNVFKPLQATPRPPAGRQRCPHVQLTQKHHRQRYLEIDPGDVRSTRTQLGKELLKVLDGTTLLLRP